MPDFYDDAIFDFDQYVQEIFKTLSSAGELDKTIVIIYTDHNIKYQTSQRIPLIIHFPKDEYSGRVENNAQNLDIAPTILDYMGISIPSWMTGYSLIRGEPDSTRNIFSATAGRVDPKLGEPPFYQFGTINLVVCNKWYRFNTYNNLLFTGSVKGHTSPCENSIMPNIDSIRSYFFSSLVLGAKLRKNIEKSE
jgi:hypothetical protein